MPLHFLLFVCCTSDIHSISIVFNLRFSVISSGRLWRPFFTYRVFCHKTWLMSGH